MSALEIKDSVLRYLNPFDENKPCYVYSNEGITDLDLLARETIPAGIEYTVISQNQAHQELQGTDKDVSGIPITLPEGAVLPNAVSRNTLGYFGNIWVRQNTLAAAGDFTQGHKHHFDHVSMLISGKVQVEVDGFEPTEFTAPTFIVIKKDCQHKFTALEDNSAWFCVFALRDVDGNVTDIYSGDNSPYGRVASGDMTILNNTSIE
jgi:hypothetical protein